MNFKKINNEENNLYDQQNKWLNAVNEKKEKNFEKKLNKEHKREFCQRVVNLLHETIWYFLAHLMLSFSTL